MLFGLSLSLGCMQMVAADLGRVNWRKRSRLAEAIISNWMPRFPGHWCCGDHAASLAVWSRSWSTGLRYSEGGLVACRVVERFDPLEDRVCEFGPCRPDPRVEQLDLHRAEECLDHLVLQP
jgi:hypothetical protein